MNHYTLVWVSLKAVMHRHGNGRGQARSREPGVIGHSLGYEARGGNRFHSLDRLEGIAGNQ